MTIGAGGWRPQLWVGSAAGTSYPGGSGWLLGSPEQGDSAWHDAGTRQDTCPWHPKLPKEGTCPQQPFLGPMLQFPASQALADLHL